MSTVVIRSQNRERLLNFNQITGICYHEAQAIKKEPERHTICVDFGGLLEEVAEYKSKERCLEVLDEAQKKIGSYLTVIGGAAVTRGGMDIQPAAYSIPILYELPEV